MNRVPVVAAVVLATTALAGCTAGTQDANGPAAAPSSVPVASNRPVAASSAESGTPEATFLAEMIAHHQQAITMSDLALTNAGNLDVRMLAGQIRATQRPEIEQMTLLLGGSPHAGHESHGTTGTGMLDEEQMQTLTDARGAAFDRLWLQGMIAHHQGAVEMAEPFVGSSDTQIATLARGIVDTQTVEISRMRLLLGALS